MGKKGSWLSSIKKALSPNSKEKKSQKSKKKGLGDEKSSGPVALIAEPVGGSRVCPPLPSLEEVKPLELENEHTKHVSLVAVEAALESVQLTKLTQYSGKSSEEVAAIRIQTAFRGYLARRALRALRGLVRLKTLVNGPTADRQTANTLKCMQNLSRMQSQINSRRLRMSEENQALQRQLLQKQAKELESLQMGEEWNDSLQSKEQIEAKLMSKYEATMRRERAMAYSFSHQKPWKKSSRTTNLLFMDPTNPQWGWSWLERYMETRAQKDNSSVKTGISITGVEIAKSYARHQLNSTSSTPKSTTRRLKPGPNPRAFKSSFGPGPDNDSKSLFSVQSEVNRRHSIAGSSVRDDESLASSPSVPSYMAQTKSAKAKSRGQSVLGPEENPSGPNLEIGFGLGPKKRLLFPGSPARPRRHSGPPKVESGVSMEV